MPTVCLLMDLYLRFTGQEKSRDLEETQAQGSEEEKQISYGLTQARDIQQQPLPHRQGEILGSK